jgi:hypothetical protein
MPPRDARPGSSSDDSLSSDAARGGRPYDALLLVTVVIWGVNFP